MTGLRTIGYTKVKVYNIWTEKCRTNIGVVPHRYRFPRILSCTQLLSKINETCCGPLMSKTIPWLQRDHATFSAVTSTYRTLGNILGCQFASDAGSTMCVHQCDCVHGTSERNIARCVPNRLFPICPSAFPRSSLLRFASTFPGLRVTVMKVWDREGTGSCVGVKYLSRSWLNTLRASCNPLGATPILEFPPTALKPGIPSAVLLSTRGECGQVETVDSDGDSEGDLSMMTPSFGSSASGL